MMDAEKARVDERELFRLWNQCSTILVGCRVELRSAEERSAFLAAAVKHLEAAVRRIGAAFTARALGLDTAQEVLGAAMVEGYAALAAATRPDGAK